MEDYGGPHDGEKCCSPMSKFPPACGGVKGGCSAFPSGATKCRQLIPDTTAYDDYDMTLSPNLLGDANAAAALTRFDGLPSSLRTCNANAELFFCSMFFPDCPEKGWFRKPCRQLCQVVRTDCESAYNAQFDPDWPWDCNDLHDTGGNDELCLHPEGDFLNTAICGTRVTTASQSIKIVNGQNAPEAAWPWQVSLRTNNFHFCGGSLLDENTVITAAHCIGGAFTMVLGDTIRSEPTANHKEVQPSAIITHPDYDPNSIQNDVALVRFSESITFNDHIRPICLSTLVGPVNEEKDHYRDCYATGWGRLEYQGASPDHLQEVSVPIWTLQECQNMWWSFLTDQNICAGTAPDNTLGTGTCQGDSGGPLVCKGYDDDRWHLLGVTSFGPSGYCAQVRVGVFARVTNFFDWIDAQINGPNAIDPVACDDENSWQCSEWSNNLCILATSRCDGNVFECERAEDELNCGNCGNDEFSVPSGQSIVFQSPGFNSGGYSNNVFCQWTFTSPEDTQIKVQFTDFDLESNYDYVYVGTESGVGPLSRRFSYTGNTNPVDWTSGGNVVAITMITDESVAENGFQVTLTATGDPGNNDNPAYLDTNVCGSRPTVLPMISGSQQVTAGWPWMGSIRVSWGAHLCGITLIDTEWAITTRTCINQASYAVFGDHTTSTSSTVSSHVERNFCGIFVHPTLYITLIKLCIPVVFSTQVAPACLHTNPGSEITDYEMQAGDTSPRCRILGWGAQTNGGSEASTLREAEVNLASDNCGFSTSFLCVANTDTSTAGPCSGDLGGPLTCIGEDNKWRLVGVGINSACDTADAEHPFVRTSDHQQFITDSQAVDADCANMGRRCHDGRCYLDSGRCNNYYECTTREDEYNCDSSCQVVGSDPDQNIDLATQSGNTITISSANYPSVYDVDVECFWAFTSPSNSNIRFNILAFTTELDYDFVRIGSGSNPSANQQHELHGTVSPVMYTINSNTAWMTFSSDFSIVDTGFSIEVTYV